MSRLLIRAGQLIDGTGAAPIEGAALLADGERIVAVGRAADLGSVEGALVIDAPHATLMPGLIDAHVHLAFSGINNSRAFRAELAELNYARIALRAARFARDTLEAGFTSVRDMHAPGGTIIDLAAAIERGDVDGPRVKACGAGLCPTGGHMDQPGWADHTWFRDMTAPCDGPVEFLKGVRVQMKRGADFIKINSCVSYRKDSSRNFKQEMTDAEIEAVCHEAHEHGLKVASHTSGGPGLVACVRYGVDTIEHGHWIDDATLELMALKGLFLVPTLLVNERNFETSPEEQGISEAGMRWLRAARESKWDVLARARKAGVRILCGSDTGFMLEHGRRNAEEIALLVQGGLSPMEAIVAATGAAADAIEVDAGRLQQGRYADLLLVEGDPLAEIRVLQDRSKFRIWKGGAEVTGRTGTAT